MKVKLVLKTNERMNPQMYSCNVSHYQTGGSFLAKHGSEDQEWWCFDLLKAELHTQTQQRK